MTDTGGNLEARIRDLEERDRAGEKSRTLMHVQLEHLNTKMDLMLSRQDEKVEDCAAHKTKTALVEAAVASVERAAAEHHQHVADRLTEHEADIKWAYRTALGGACVAAVSLAGFVFQLMR